MQPLAPSLFQDDKMQKFWGTVMDALPFYVLLVDEHHKILAWNEAMRKSFSIDEPFGQYCPSVVHGLSEPYEGCPLEDAVADNRAVEKQLFDTATQRWVASSIYPTTLRTQENARVYLHFSRDITEEKRAQANLAVSLEHHKALGLLLQRLQKATTPAETLETLVDVVLGLSWIDQTCGAAAFLSHDNELSLVHFRNLNPSQQARCARIPFGQCLCGRAAAERVPLVFEQNRAQKLPLLDHEPSEHGHATFPLVYEGRTLGVINLYLHADRSLSPAQLTFFEAAVAVAAAALAEQQSKENARNAMDQVRQLERRLFEKVVESQEEERKRVARELHDDLGQALSALLLDVKTMSRADRTSATEVCERMDLAVRDLIGRVYALAWDLRPSVLDDYGLDSALSRHIANVAKRSDVLIDYRFVKPVTQSLRLPSSIEVLLYRVTQEALSNAIKHSHARQLSVVVICREHEVALVVEDDGQGFDTTTPRRDADERGLGLIGMRERVALLRGKLDIESAAGQGTSLRVTVPISAL